MSDCIFCKIANKEMDSEIVHETDRLLAFKDVDPQAPVHILIIPKDHIESVMDFDQEHADMISEMFFIAQEIAKEFGVDDSGFRLVNNCGTDGGQTVNHFHLHLLGNRQMSWPPG